MKKLLREFQHKYNKIMNFIKVNNAYYCTVFFPFNFIYSRCITINNIY